MIQRQPDENETARIVSRRQRRIPLVFFGILIGAVGGAIVCLYRFLLDRAFEYALVVYRFVAANPALIIPWFAALFLLALAVRALLRFEPMIAGSGIPQIKGLLLRQIDMNWWKVLAAKFAGGLLCVAAGFAVGREGPSIQLGGAAGQGIRRLFNRPEYEEKYLVTGGASAGLSAAFNAPLSGVVFALEEVHGHFSPAVLITAMSAAISADLVAKLAFGGNAVLDFHMLPVLPMPWYGCLVLLGLLTGAGGALFNLSLLRTQDAYGLVPERFRIFIPFALCGVAGLLMPSALGGGHSLILSLSGGNGEIWPLVLLLLVRFGLTMACFGSGAPGGIFLPLLAVGALLGAVFGQALTGLAGMEAAFVPTFVALAMAGYFTAVVRAPVTGILLITEMTGSFSHLLSLSIVVIASYLTAEALKSRPVYESLLLRLLRRERKPSGGEGGKVLMEAVVHVDSAMDGRRVSEVGWPEGCLVIGIRRGSEELIPRGGTVIRSGDMVVAITDAGRAAAAKRRLVRLASRG